MDISLKIESNEFSVANVRETINYALRTQVELTRIRRDHFAKLCLAFENEHQLSSSEFLRNFDNGELGDDAYLFDWYAAKRGLDLWQQRFAILNGLSLEQMATDTIKDTDVAYDVSYSLPPETLPTSRRKTAREILEEAGMVRLLGDELTSLIDDDIPSLDEIINALSAAGGPSLTEILDEQRGPKTWRISS